MGNRLKTISAAIFLLAPLSSRGAEYLLGPQDKLRISVYEWRAAVSEVYQWEALSGDFTINSSGEISLPLIGNVKASGLPLKDFGDAIAKRMQATIGLANVPTVALEVSQYRPFYVVGNVEKAGEYPFRPELTILQALSIAGGLPKTSELSLLRLGRDIIAQSGEVEQTALQRDGLLVRKARLDSEMQGLDAVALPETIKKRAKEPVIAVAIEQEEAIFKVRKDALKTEIDALMNLEEFFKKELVSLEGQVRIQTADRGLVENELNGVKGLVEKGLTAGTRQTALQRTMVQLEGDRFRLEGTLLKARQEISRAEISIIEAKNKFATELTASARENTSKLNELNAKLSTSQTLLQEAEMAGPRALAARHRASIAKPSFRIVRRIGDRVVNVEAEETAFLEPGDTLKVELALPEEAVSQ